MDAIARVIHVHVANYVPRFRCKLALRECPLRSVAQRFYAAAKMLTKLRTCRGVPQARFADAERQRADGLLLLHARNDERRSQEVRKMQQ